MFGYTARLKGDLARWRDEGRITPEQEASLYADALSRGSAVSITTIVGLLGAALLGLAVITFVSANWDGLTKLHRLIVLFGALWAAYGVAYVLFRTAHEAFAEMALLIANTIFGANVMLIAQTYHISGYTPDGVLLWMAGVFVSAALARSTPSLVLAVGLLAVWIIADSFDRSSMAVWQFGLAWLVGLGLAVRQDSVVALHALCLAAIVWMIAIGVENRGLFWPFVFVGLVALAAGLWLERKVTQPAVRRMLPALAVYGALVAVGAVLLQQFEPDRVSAVMSELAFHVLASIIVLTGTVALIVRGTLDGRRGLTAVGFLGFGAELLYLYEETLGSLLSTAIFYLTAGVLLIALSFAFLWLERRRGSRGAHS